MGRTHVGQALQQHGSHVNQRLRKSHSGMKSVEGISAQQFLHEY